MWVGGVGENGSSWTGPPFSVGAGAGADVVAGAVVVVVEVVVAAILALRMASAYDMGLGTALWHGVFHSVSAFNNAGFSTHADSVMGYQSDPIILVPIMLAVILTALGFPVMQDLRDRKLEVIGANTGNYHGVRAYFGGEYVKAGPLNAKMQAKVMKAAKSGELPEE